MIHSAQLAASHIEKDLNILLHQRIGLGLQSFAEFRLRLFHCLSLALTESGLQIDDAIVHAVEAHAGRTFWVKLSRYLQ